MPNSTSDKAFWELLRFSAPLILGYMLIELGTNWAPLLVLSKDAGPPAGFLLTGVTLLGGWVIIKSIKRNVGS